MSKQLYLIGNLKMNMNKQTLMPYLEKLKHIALKTHNKVGVCVPFVYLNLSSEILRGSKVLIGAQNMHNETSGAFTGEVSAQMLNDYNTNLVIIGHSERRTIFNESDELVNKKLLQALNNNLTPILCVGESLIQKNQGKTTEVLKNQLNAALIGVKAEDLVNIIIAYEPIWAIGTGVSATKNDAESAILFIKNYLQKHFNASTKVLYGGSLNEKNAYEILSQPSIDGGLIGGASLSAESFEKIINTNIN